MSSCTILQPVIVQIFTQDLSRSKLLVWIGGSDGCEISTAFDNRILPITSYLNLVPGLLVTFVYFC